MARVPRLRRWWWLVPAFYLLTPHAGVGQTFMEGGARAAALGGTATALPHDIWGTSNPAAWASLERRAVAFLATEAFGLPELRLGAVQLVQPTRIGALAVGARSFGFEAYRETHWRAGIARTIGRGEVRRASLGVSIEHRRVSIRGYGRGAGTGVVLGSLVAVLPSVHVGLRATASGNGKGPDAVRLHRALGVGLSFQPVEQVLVLCDAVREMRFPWSLRTGVEVRPFTGFFLRAGATSRPSRITAGAGFRVGRLTADVAGEHHAVLGWSPAVSASLLW